MVRLLLLMLLLGSLYGCQKMQQGDTSIDHSLKVCIDRSESLTSRMVDCGNEAYARWEQEVDRYCKLLMDILPGEAKVDLEKSQTAWIKFKDLEFQTIPSLYTGIAGTFRGPAFLEHKIDVFRVRALQLKAYYDGIKGE